VIEPLPAGALREVLFGLVIALIPISAGIAILRYRLYRAPAFCRIGRFVT
jgi:hypothetical protein